MEHFAGLDVSVNETSVCIVDDTGRIVREVKVEGLGADSEEKREPASDIDTILVDSLKALDPNRPISATIAFFTARRLAICIAQALSQDHLAERTSRIWAAS